MQIQSQLPQLSRINKILLIAMVSLFLLSSIAKASFQLSLLGLLGLSVEGLLSGKLYQLITFPLVESNLIGVLFNGLIFWFLGSELEWRFGPRRYLYFLLSSLWSGALFFLLVSSILGLHFVPLYGLAGVASAMCVAYAIFYPERLFTFMFLFPMKAKYFCGLIVLISLYNGFFSPGRAGAWAQLGMMLGGGLWVVFLTSEGRGLWQKKFRSVPKKRSAQNSHLKLVKKEDDDETPKYWH